MAGFELTGESVESRVLAGAHLLSYLTWIAMFQAKSGRQYWWVLALSVMQVAVAAILTEQGVFGILLVTYVFCGMWTLAVYSVYQAYQNFEQAGQGRTRIDDLGKTSANATGQSIKREQQRASRMASPQTSELSPVHRQRAEYRSAIQLDPDQRWINTRFVVGVVSTAILSMAVGMVFFMLVPRLWVSRRTIDTQDLPPILSMSGFTDEVRLGEIGRILESNKPVLQAWFYQAGSDTPMTIDEVSQRHGYRDAGGIAGEPLFRGSIMGRYEKGRWYVLDESRQAAQLQPPQIRLYNHYIRQEYVLEQTGTKTLFAIHPVFWADRADNNKTNVAMDVVTSILMRDDERSSGGSSFKYTVYSYSPGTRVAPRIGYHADRESRAMRRAAQSQFAAVPRGLTKLTAVAKQVESRALPDEPQPAPADPEESEASSELIAAKREVARRTRIAEAIESYLRDSPDFTYSLTSAAVDPNADPVEDFLVNRKSGHCEYYASAMALMMRSLGIESRLVSGFKGGEVNMSGAFVVAERHAHAWVEVLIGRYGDGDGEWRTYDPTPASRSDVVREIGAEQGIMSTLSELAKGLWHQRVIRLSIQDQRRAIYSPLGDWLKSKLMLLGPIGTAVATHLSNPEGWFSWQTFVGVFCLVLGSFVFRKLWRRVFPNGFLRSLIGLVKSLTLSVGSRRNRVRIEFYERYLRILARRGLTRRAMQTPLEFAVESLATLREKLQNAGLDDMPDDIARRFYQVRYGNQPLTAAEQLAVEQLLAKLKEALGKKS